MKTYQREIDKREFLLITAMNFCKTWPYILIMCVHVIGDDIQERMLGGADISPELYPFAVLVIIDGVAGTGTIVTQKWVLTINQWKGKELKVQGLVKAGKRFYYTSTEEVESYAQVRNIKQLHKSPFQDLIGSALLLLLEEPFVFDKTVEPALFTRNRRIPGEDICFVVGFGGEGNKTYAVLSGNDWPVRSCDNAMGMEQLCSPFGIHGVPCYGDYGAPAVCGNCVTGILLVPDGFGDCRLADRYEFLFVPYLLNWIKKLAPEVRTSDCFQFPDFREDNFSPKYMLNHYLVIVSLFLTIVFDKCSIPTK